MKRQSLQKGFRAVKLVRFSSERRKRRGLADFEIGRGMFGRDGHNLGNVRGRDGDLRTKHRPEKPEGEEKKQNTGRTS